MFKVLFIVFFVLLSVGAVAQEQIVSIIPQPVDLRLEEGYFTIDEHTSFRLQNSRKELQPVVAFFRDYIGKISGHTLPVKRKEEQSIQFSIEEVADIGAEGYKLSVSPASIKIRANTKAGIIYGMQSVLQTLPAIRTNAALQVPVMEITDFPRFKWRGLHLDVSRHFFSPEMIKEYIDLLASYKLNKFHWHLIDDQGWRMEIKKYPELTNVGAWRGDHTDKVWGERPQAKEGEPATYGGYYTQEQIKEIIDYAALRNVTIVPEVEMPGHVASAIATFPHLSCTQKPQLPLTGGNYTGISSNYCPGNEDVFAFLEDVLDEVVELFPSEYIHIGGDEVNKSSWEKCNKCQARIKEEGLEDEHELQSYFIKRIEQYLISKNRKMMGWDEILEGGLAPEATVMSWRGEAGGIEAAKMGHDVVMTPGSPVYFDHYQAGPEGEPLAIGGFNSLKKVYDYEPIPEALSNREEKYIMGAQANVWTEYITTAEHLEYMILPRMPALAEVVWSPKESRDWNSFNQRIQEHFRAYEQKGFHYCPGNFTADIKPTSQGGKLEVNLFTEILNGEIYFTTDGSTPTTGSDKYQHPIQIDSSITLKAVTGQNGKIMSYAPATQTFAVHKAVGRAVAYSHPVSSYYQADGPNSLTDGVRGTASVGKYWHGFYAKDLISTIDLGKEQSISSIAIGCLQKYGDWIFLPTKVEFEISTDGQTFTKVSEANNDVSVHEEFAIKNFEGQFGKQIARYVRVKARNLGICPKGHSGEGKAAWLFADEIIVK
jgi:hexosaminidase